MLTWREQPTTATTGDGDLTMCGVTLSAASVQPLSSEPDSKAYLRASRLMANWMVARVTKDKTVAARIS